MLVLNLYSFIEAKDLTNVLKSVGIDADNDAVNRVIDALKGKELHEVIASGLTKVSSVAVGGGSSSGGAATGGAGGAAAKEEAPKEEEEEDDDMDGGLDLFGF